MNFLLQDKVPSFSPKFSDRLLPFFQGGLSIALILFLFSLPLAYITSIREITLGLAVFFRVSLMVLNKQGLRDRTPLDWPLLAWGSVALLSLVWAVNPAYSFNEIKGEVIKGGIAFYLFAHIAQKSDYQKQFLFSLFLGNLFLILYAIWDFWQIGGSLNTFEIRARSLHSSYPEFGAYLIIILPIILLSFFSPLMKSFRWILGALVCLNFFCIYITFGRAMWLAATLEILLVGWLLKKKKLVLIFLLGLLLLPLVLPKSVWFHGEKLPVSVKAGSQKIGGTGGDLIDIWKLAYDFIRDRPFQGIGYGRQSFSEAFPVFRANHQPLLWHAHNTFLNVTFQMGIQGLLVFMWLMGTILFHTYRRGKVGPDCWSGLLNQAVWVMVIGFFIRNFFDDLYVDDNLLLFWCLAGVALTPSEKGEFPQPIDP